MKDYLGPFVQGFVRVFVVLLLTLLIALVVSALLSGCTHWTLATPTPGPDYQATIDVAQARLTECLMANHGMGVALDECRMRPTQTPHVIVVTPVPPTLVPVTATPPYPANLVACDEAPLGTRLYVTTRTTVRYWHSEASNNLGQAAAGESGVLIDKSKDADALWWWRADGLVTNDHPYGTKGWVKAIYSGCVPPK